MITDWQTLYRAALNEKDSARIPEACEKARSAISERLKEIERPSQAALNRREIEGIDEASRQLWLHENNQ